MEGSRLVGERVFALNRGLLAMRIGLYAAIAIDVSRNDSPPWLPALVVTLGLLPALPLRGLAQIRVEAGIVISLVLEGVLWLGHPGSLTLRFLPLFSVAVAGLLLPRSMARAILVLATAAQASQMALVWAGRVPGFDDMLGESVLLVVSGMGFLEIGAVLRAYQERVVDQGREEFRLTEVIRQRDRLISTVAHEIRTPLTVVLGLTAELGQGRIPPEEVSAIATMAASEAQRLSGIVDNMVVVARSEIGGLGAPKSDTVEIGEIARSAWRRMTPEDGALHINGSAVVDCDARRLDHVFSNLFDNVQRHGKFPATVDLVQHGSVTWIAVHDAGPGIEPEDLSKVGIDRDDARPDNLGLGLEVAQMLLSTMHGELVTEQGAAVFSLRAPA